MAIDAPSSRAVLTSPMDTVRDALGAATDALVAAGVESPRLDAELLLAEALGTDRARLAADPGAGIDASAARAFGGAIRRRIRREPVAYILGRKGFRHIDLAVDGRVLIPRPETELLVEVALDLQPGTVLDIGTGSGAVALAIASEIPQAEVIATDTSPDALMLARDNAWLLGLDDRVQFVDGSVPDVEADLVVANLPYVAEDDWSSLQPEIREWEPQAALLAGPDGLGAFREVIPALRAGAVALEIGEGQAVAVTELLRAAGYSETSVRRDLAGIERVVVGRRTGDGPATR